MHQFKDNHTTPRLWTLTLNIASVKRVKELLPGVDLMDVSAVEGEDKTPLIVRLLSDPVLLCDVLYVLCKPEADTLGVKDEQFGEAMGGSAIHAGQEALLAELIDFFQSLGRTEIVTVMRQAETLRNAAVTAAAKNLAGLDVAALATAAVGNSFTAARESLDKALTLTPSANSSG